MKIFASGFKADGAVFHGKNIGREEIKIKQLMK